MSAKAQAEHNESAHPPIADMKADIDFCRYGPGTAVVIAQVSLARRKADINAGLPEEGRHRLPSSGRYVISELREMSII